jgi:hypothetical protein
MQLLKRVERERLLHVARGAGDDGRVETEDQAADRGDEGDGDDIKAGFLHIHLITGTRTESQRIPYMSPFS